MERSSWRVAGRALTVMLLIGVLAAGYYILVVGPEEAKAPRVRDAVSRSERRPAGAELAQGAYDYNTNLMARVIYAESRGEPYVGQVGVGAVIMNRVESPLFPHPIPGVVFEPWAFTVVSTGEIWWHMPDRTAYRAAWDALSGWDPTGGALYYYNPARVSSPWIWNRPPITRIGNHIFTR